MPLHAHSAPAPASRTVLAALRSPAAVHRGRAPFAPGGGAGASPQTAPRTGLRAGPQTGPVTDRETLPESGLETGPETGLEIELPLPVHELTDPGMAPGAAVPSSTRLTGWRFLLREPGAPEGSPAVGAAETLLTSDGWAFAYFCGGPFVASSQRALRQAESLPGLHQPRLLSVPRLYMLTLWLHGDVSADIAEGSPQPADLLIPLAPAPPGIAAHVPHRADALLPLLTGRPAAPTRLLRSGR